MPKRLSALFTACAGVALLGGTWLATAWLMAPAPARVPMMVALPGALEPHGQFQLSRWQDGTWIGAGALPADRFSREQSVPLGLAGEPVRLRITVQGGGNAHLDQVALTGYQLTAVQGAPLEKLRERDNDVADAHTGPIELHFEPAGIPMQGAAALRVVGRIEASDPGGVPFRYPASNTYRGAFDADSEYYRYTLGSRPGRLTLDGELAGESLGRPFFANWQRVGSGHPQAPTYGWVRNDETHLYVALDFASDNTMDGDKDFAAVTVNLPAGPRRFRVSVPEQTWGRPGFTYTDQVGWQHKVYEFAIPLAALGIAPDAPAPLQLAFEAYGTSAPPAGSYTEPRIAFDTTNDCFVTVGYDDSGSPYPVETQLLSESGSAVGSAQTVSEIGTDDSSTDPAIAFDTTNNRYLVTWTEFNSVRYVRTRLMNANGTAAQGVVDIPASTDGDSEPRVAFNPNSGQFLVVFAQDEGSGSNIAGRLISAAGAVQGSSDISIYSTISSYDPDVAYDPVNSRYLVVMWNAGDIYLQELTDDGSTDGSPQPVHSGLADTAPGVAVGESGTALVVWEESSTFRIVRGRLYNVAGNSFGTAFAINQSTSSDARAPSVAYDPVNDQYLVVWAYNNDIYGRRINASGSTVGDEFTINTGASGQEDAHVAANLLHGGFVVVFGDTNSGTWGVEAVAAAMLGAGGAAGSGWGGFPQGGALVLAGLLGLWLLAGLIGRRGHAWAPRLRPVRRALATALVLHMVLLGGLAACAGSSGGGGGGSSGTSVPTTCQLQ